METTKPDGSLDNIVDNLIFEPPTNPEPEAEEAVEATEDTQTEAVEDADVVEDDSDALDTEDEITDAEDVEVEETEVQEEPLYTVKIDGEERQVTLAELTQDFSGQKYIQKGMAENASVKKELETAKQEFAQQQEQVAHERQALMQMARQMQSGEIPPIPQPPSEELKSSDPVGWTIAAEEYRQALDQRNKWENNVKAMAEREAMEKQNEEKQFLSQQAMRLQDWMPEFADPQKRSLFIQDMTKKAEKHYQLTPEQMATVKTADEVMILTDALKYRELMANKSNATKKAKDARPTVVTPSARKSNNAGKASRAKKSKANMQKTGSIDDVAKYIGNL